jgi:hypothetical protein
VQSKRRRRSLGAAIVGFVATLAALAPATPALGQDLGAALSSAEASAASAEAQVAEAQARVAPARQRYAAVSAEAHPAQRAARAAGTEVREEKAEIAARRNAAEEQIAMIDAAHRSEAEDHDSAVQGGVGVALAALVAAGLALGWGWFRAGAAIAWLVAQRRSQALGLCVGGGVVVLIAGAALSAAGGVVGAIGVFVFALGPLLAAALLLARHSAEVQAGRERALLGRERLPAWLTRSLAGVAGVLCLALFAGALFSSGPRTAHVSPAMRQTAAGAVPTATSHKLAAAEARATALGRRAARLTARQGAARAALRKARAELASAQSHLAAAEGDMRRYVRRIEVAERREAHRREREEQQALIEAEEVEELEEGSGSGCDPSYEGECLQDGIGDYDCAGGSGNGPNYVYSEVRVVGVDVFGLDADGNGIGCEGE